MMLPAVLMAGAVEGVWPVTVAGWVTLVASLGTLVLIPFSYGKWIQKMNGLGQRVTEVEDASKLQSAFSQEDSKRRLLAEQDGNHLRERVREVEVRVDAIERNINEHHIEQRTLIQEIGRQQMEALHALELRVEGLSTNVETMTSEVRELRSWRHEMSRRDG